MSHASPSPAPTVPPADSTFIRAMPALFVVIWSSGFVVAKFGLPYAPPLTFLEWRYAAALVLLLAAIRWARAPWPETRGYATHIAVAGVLVHAGYLGGIWCAINLGMPAGLAALVAGLQPVLTAFAGPWLGERVGLKQWVGLVLGLIGVALVLANKITLIGLTAGSIALAVLALLSITIGTLYQKRFCPRFDLRTGAFLQYSASFIVTLPFAFAFEDGRVDWTPQMLLALGWSVLGLSFGAIFLLFLLIRHGGATRVVSLFYLTPPMTALMAWAAFGESLSILALFGMALAVLGVALVVRKSS